MERKQERLRELGTVIHNLLLEPTTMFYGMMLAEISKEFTKVPGVGTACLTTNLNTLGCRILFDPEFWDGLDKDERITQKNKTQWRHKQRTFVLRHELAHYYNTHYLLHHEFGWDKKLINISTDLSINSKLVAEIEEVEKNKKSLISQMQLIDGVLLPSSYPEIPMEWGRESNYYYNILSKAKKQKEETGTSGSPLLDKQLDSKEDIHATWEEITQGMSDVEKEILKRKIDAQIERAAQDTEKQMGNIPIDIQEAIKRIAVNKKPVVSWKDVIRRFAGSVPSNDVTVNRKRPSRRFPDAFATKILQKVAMVIGNDSSGSVLNDQLDRLNTEIHHVWKAGAKVDYFPWDAEVGETREYKGNLNFQREKCGGTNLNVALTHLNTNYQKYGWNCAVIGTDGHVPAITVRCKIPVLIVIVPGGNLKFANPYNYKTIMMND